SFLTWPHALFYAGRAGSASVLAIYLLESAILREPRARWLPPGFPLILLSTILFLSGGAFDLGWHALFGFEATLEALLSPAHIWLSVSALVFTVGLLQAALEKGKRHGRPAHAPRLADVPIVLAVGMLFRVTLWNLLYSDPLAVDYASAGTLVSRLPAYVGIPWGSMAAQIAGTTGIVTHSILLALFLVVSCRYLRLPYGAIAAVMLWDGALTAMISDTWLYLPAVAVGATAGELIWAAMWRGRLGGLEGEKGYWTLAGAVPLVQFSTYFGLMHVYGGGIVWSTHLWAGAPIMGSLYGLIAGALVVPPRFVRDVLRGHSPPASSRSG
ncbi:MAG: hypothetical protein ACREMB_12065, partial [Candidatus Rokuibacteriota bacterium]